MKPYYQDEWVTIYLGDCRDILPTLEKADLVLTDPPYGINLEYGTYQDTIENWRELFVFLVDWIATNAVMGIFPSGGIDKLPYVYQTRPPLWLICWYKGSTGHLSKIGFNSWESLLVYGKRKGLQMHDYFQTHTRPANNGHPCPKPDGFALHLITKTTETGELVIDPFLGSGTTAVCAKKLNRKCIGIEIEEKYCEIAAKRCSQSVFNFKE